MTRVVNPIDIILALTVSLACLSGCNTSSPVSGEEDGTETSTTTESSPRDTGSGPEDTGSVPEETGSEPEDTTPPVHGQIAGTISLMESPSAEGVSVALYDNAMTQVESLETGESGEYEFLEVLPGSYTVKVSKTGYVNDERRVEVKAGEVTSLDFILSVDASQGAYRLEYVSGGSNGKDPHQQGTVGQSLKQALGVRLVDGKGAPVSFAEMVYEVVEGRQGGAVDSQGIVTGPKGDASNGYVLGTKAGENHVRVWSKAGGNSIHFYPQGQADLPSILTVVSGSGQIGQVGAALSSAISVKAQDKYENPVPGATIVFSPGMEGAASPGQALTDVNGVAQTSWTMGSKLQVNPPEQELVARSGELEVKVYAINISRTPKSIEIVSGDLQSARSGEALPDPFMVEVKDDWGNPGYGHKVTWTTSTGGNVAPASSNIGQDGLAEARGTMGALLEQKFFGTLSSGQFVTFHADKVGDTKVSLTEPALVWPGYPDASALKPEKQEVTLTIRGTGFGPEAKVLWNAGSAEEEELDPTEVTATKLKVKISADHFEELGTYPIGVRNRKSDGMESFGFQVAHTLLVPSAQDSSQCTKSVLSRWEWVECSELVTGDEAYGQDGHYDEQGGGRWETGDNGIAYDNITGLTWTRCMAGQTYDSRANACEGESALPGNYKKAQEFCEEMTLGGYSDWRIPSFYEMNTLNHESDNGYDVSLFPETIEASWTGTVASGADYSTGYLQYCFDDCDVGVVESPTPVRCVRGRSLDREKYISVSTSDARIVTDVTTGLMWKSCPLGLTGSDCSIGKTTEYTWSEALAACEALAAGGYDDWRLASLKELMTLQNLDNAPVLPDFFGKKEDVSIERSFWSSTTYSSKPLLSIFLFFGGAFNKAYKDTPSQQIKASALCVRLGY